MWALVLLIGVLLITCALILRQSSHEIKYNKLHPAVNMKTTEPIDLNYPPLNIDGHMCMPGQRVLVDHQHNRVENGLYTIISHSLWSRSEDAVCDGDCIWVIDGVKHRNTLWFIVFEQGEPVQGPQPIQAVPALKHTLHVQMEGAIEFNQRSAPVRDGLYSLNVTNGPHAGYQSLVACIDNHHVTLNESTWGEHPPRVTCKHGKLQIHDGDVTWRKQQ